MISTCTIGIRIGIMPRWMAWLGYALALTLLLSIGLISWISLAFPTWVLMLSIYILLENYRRRTDAVVPLPTSETG